MNNQDASQNNATHEVALTVDILSAYVSNNSVPAVELQGLIESIHTALTSLSTGSQPQPELQVPAVSPKRSVHEDYIVCLEDGMKFKSLRRHLKAAHGMTPEEYREKWNLPSGYPMVAPGYSAARSEMARKIGLGKRKASAKRGNSRKASR